MASDGSGIMHNRFHAIATTILCVIERLVRQAYKGSRAIHIRGGSGDNPEADCHEIRKARRFMRNLKRFDRHADFFGQYSRTPIICIRQDKDKFFTPSMAVIFSFFLKSSSAAVRKEKAASIVLIKIVRAERLLSKKMKKR